MPVDGFSEVNSPNPHAEFDISWSASDDDGDLESVDLTLYELDTDGDRADTEGSVTEEVSGSSASRTTRLKANHDEGTANEYTAELVVTDSNGNSDSETVSLGEDGR